MADLKYDHASHENNINGAHDVRDGEPLAKIDASTGYICNIDEIVETHYSTLQGTTYLDHAGTTPYSTSLVDAYAADLNTHLFGNPHTASSSSQLSSRRIDELRVRVLHYLHADPDLFDLVFVANATAAIKLVADAFRDRDGGFWFGYHHDAHTSLVGVRELASLGSRCMSDMEVEAFLDHECYSGTSVKSTALFAYAGQSNMTGQRYSLDWCQRINRYQANRSKHIYSLYDAAGLLSTSPLDLSNPKTAPDYTVLSFYKIFGFPDLGGLIVRKSSADILRSRRYFGGGTVDVVSVDGVPWHAKREQSHSSLEDGTLPFHSIIALDHAMRLHDRIFGGISNISRHTQYLASEAYKKMSGLKHANGKLLCKVYGGYPNSSKNGNGPIITFNLMDSRGNWISNTEVEKLGIVKGIQFRTGGLCNPGGTARHLDLTTEQIKRNYNAGQRCGGYIDIYNNQPTGTIRISFGASSRMKDVDSFIAFLDEFFLDCNIPAQHKHGTVDQQSTRASNFIVDSIFVFPVKSCSGFAIPKGIIWPVYPKGLQFDREWCLVHQGTNIALSQKQFPQMALLKPTIDLHQRTLTIMHMSMHDRRSISIDLDNLPEFEAVMQSSCGRYKSQNSTVCGDTILVHVYTSKEISEFFSNALGVACTLARFPPDEEAQHRRISIRRPASSPEPSPDRQGVSKAMGLKLSNESPILLISRSSVDTLNRQIQEKSRLDSRYSGTISSDSEDSSGKTSSGSIKRIRAAVNPDSFRGNIVIAETGNTHTPYAEDDFEQIHIRGSRFDVLGPCQRCQMVCVDQQNGTRKQEPFSTLAKTRRKDGRVWFGMHLCLNGQEPASVSVGDAVDIEYARGS